ncbi:MAG: wax ester/triacylglycerol synthase domain-containing protein [Solirubrobacterales bacterium]
MAERIPLDEQDLRILELEGPTLVGHTCKVVRLEAPGVEFDALMESVAGKVTSVPELMWKLDQRPGSTDWIHDEDFRIDRHLVSYGDGAVHTEAGIAAAASDLFSERLDRDRPLWRIDVVRTEDGGSALIWRIHHALADGTTAMRLAREILWEEAAETPAPAAPAPASGPAEPAHDATRKEDDERRRHHLIGLFEREFTREPGPSPFDGQIGTERSIAFATICLSQLHDAGKKAADATLNDSVLSVVAGAIRHWMEIHHEQHLGPVRVRVPVSLHHGDHDGGNRDSFFSVPLPLNEPDPILRLKEIRDATHERKADHDAEELDSLLRRVGHTSPRLRHLYSKFESNPRRFALNISNVRGPAHPVAVLDAQVETVHSIAEIGERHALRVAALSVGDRLCFGFCADPDLVVDLDVMAEGIEWAADRLVTGAK